MSAMLESYDMQVLEYTQSNDIDIQMHPTSDSWAHDETQMEEDGPSPHRLSSPHHQRADNSLSMKTDSLIKDGSDVAIEIDMLDYAGEEHVEYEMLDAVDHFEAGPDILDVEVFDASHAHTPTLNPAPLEEPKSVGLLTPQPPSAPLPSLSSPALHPISTEAPFPEAGPSEPAEGVIQENHPEVDHPLVDHVLLSTGAPLPASGALEVVVVDPTPSDLAPIAPELDQDTHSSHPDVEGVPPALTAPGKPSSGDAVGQLVPAPVEAGPAHWDAEVPQAEDRARDSMFGHPDEGQGGEPVASSDPNYTAQGHPETGHGHDVPPGYDHEVPDETGPIHAPSASSGDPHEISEGVYIDPPPPVLLTLAEDFSFSLFNRPTSVDSGQVVDLEAVHVVLEQSPTLFYEPLDTVFEALKHEEVVQSLPGFPECELVLEAVDLGLSLSEDNVNSRSMSLHDLNMLHDSLGIQGRLRVKLSTGEVRFLARYHALEEQIARIQSEVQSSDHYAPPPHVPDSSEEDKLLDQHADKPEQAYHDATSAAQPPSTEYESRIPSIPDSDDNVPATEEHHQEPDDYAEEQYDSATVQGIDQTEARDDHHQVPEYQPNDGDYQHADDRSHTLSDNDDSHSGVVAGHQDTSDPAVREAESAVVADEAGEDENTSSSYNESEEAEETYDHEVTQDVPEAPEYDQGDADDSQEAAEDQQDVSYWDNPDEGEYEDNDPQVTTDEDGEVAEADQDDGEPEAAENEADTTEVQDNERSESGDFDDDHNSVTVIVNEQVVQLELPSEPLEFGDEDWDDELDGEGDLDAAWDADPENPLPSVDVADIDRVPSPLSSKPGGKRNYDQVDVDEDEETWDQASGTGSPGSKRSRVQ